MQVLKWIVYLIIVLAVALLLAGRLGLLQGHPPDNLGVHDGKLAAPSKTDNSVSSQADLWPGNPMHEQAQIAPLALKGSGEATVERIKSIVERMSGAKVVESRDDYLQVQFTSRVMKFVDDAEFWFDPVHQVIQVRSASRIGRKDLGVNRARIEAIRARLQAS